mgnify:FL=1
MIAKRAGPRPGVVLVTFRLPDTLQAESVHLVGDMNDWDRHSLPLNRAHPEGPWEVTIEVEQGRTYHFRYLVDGAVWQNDWDADGYATNPFGGNNSVLRT